MTARSAGAASPDFGTSAEDEPDPAQHRAASHASLESLRRLYDEHSQRLVGQLTHDTGCRETALDLAQEAFVKLLRMGPAKFQRIARPEAYLRRTSFNLARDRHRERLLAERSNAALAVLERTAFDQLSMLESRDTLRRLEAAMARLKPRTRDIFLAHRLEGLSYSEIAERTGLSVKGVEKQMSKAIAKIDRLLDRS